jgi:hypothetical protein
MFFFVLHVTHELDIKKISILNFVATLNWETFVSIHNILCPSYTYIVYTLYICKNNSTAAAAAEVANVVEKRDLYKVGRVA